ncbi:MAG TPA: TRAP transporter substrate-binding protein [Candidatus Sulfotelmatobacter sp.]|nr:TRAP transporter substrate-binding protein [Candidatus Sulfotelmatobacter sp.]
MGRRHLYGRARCIGQGRNSRRNSMRWNCSRRELLKGAIASAALVSARPGLAASPFPRRTIKLGHLNTIDHPLHLGAMKFKELVEAKTDGAVKVELFPNAQLAPSESDMIQSVRLGTATMTVLSAGAMGVFVPDFQVMAVPYIWRDLNHMKKVTRGDLGANLSEQAVQKMGVRILDGARLYGDRLLTTKSKAIRTPADLNGMKIRVPEIPIYLETIRAMGATPVAVVTSEIYTALGTGVADGQENPAVSILTWKLYEVQKHLMMTAHITQNQIMVINEAFWKGLGPDLQKIVQAAAWESGDHETAMALKMNQESVASLKAKGMEIHEVDLDAFKKATSVVAGKFADKWTPGLVDRLRAVK